MFDSMLAPERTFDTMTAMSRTRVRPADLPDATSSRRVRSRRIALAIVVTAVAAAWAGPIARATTGAAEPVPVARSTYVVQRGDSLWAIAEDLSGGADPRPLVDAIARANDVDPATLAPGQTLVIPAA
jgi:nucleoid-associated protein YgaU